MGRWSLCLISAATLLSLPAHAGDSAGERPAPSPVEERVLGRLDFPTSTGNAPAQAAFTEGMLLLHLFEYEQARADFQHAETLDPKFAMAYWGEAMTYDHPVWNQQNLSAARAVLAKLAPTPQGRAALAGTPRERDFLAGLDILYGDGTKAERDKRYCDALARMSAAYPKDDEVQLFYSLALLGRSEGVRDVPTYLKAAAIAETVYRHNPEHPGAAHYWIHGMDDPQHAAGALEAARALAKIAPDAGHAQHMTSHIFMALGMWDDLVAANENAMRVVARHQALAGKPAGHCFHYDEWLEYGYLQQGRYQEASRLLQACRDSEAEDAAWYRTNPTQTLREGEDAAAFDDDLRGSLAQMRAMAVVDMRAWDGTAVHLDIDTQGLGAYAAWVDFPTAYAAAQRGDVTLAERALTALRSRLASDPEAVKESPSLPEYLDVMAGEIEGLLECRRGETEAGLGDLTRAADLYDQIPFDFGPPVPIKPPRELLGEALLAAEQPAKAEVQFKLALKAAPQRSLTLLDLVQAATAAKDDATAEAARAALGRNWQGADAGILGRDTLRIDVTRRKRLDD